MAENIIHCCSIRARVTGSGILRSKLLSLDDIQSVDIPNLTMSTTTYKEPTLLTNFSQQRMKYKIYTTDMNEYFVIRRIILYVKEVATSYPQ